MQKSNIFVKKFGSKYLKDQKYRKVGDRCHYTH